MSFSSVRQIRTSYLTLFPIHLCERGEVSSNKVVNLLDADDDYHHNEQQSVHCD